jgi:hypothetical protein
MQPTKKQIQEFAMRRSTYFSLDGVVIQYNFLLKNFLYLKVNICLVPANT